MPDPGCVVASFASGLVVAGLPLLCLWLRARRLSLFDRLTGLPNYQAFLRIAKVRLRQLRKRPLGVVLTDLDDFQRFNLRGYPFGDRVLKSFADALSAQMKGLAYCARYRLGDEFVVLFDEGCRALVEARLRELSVIDPDGKPLEFSYGIAVFRESGKNLDEMLEEVQGLLFRQKREGKTD